MFRGCATQACWLRPSNDFQPLHLVCSGHLQDETTRFRHASHPANPFSQVSGGTVDCLWRSRVAIPRSAHASTRRSHQLAQIDNDKVAPECNAAVCQERDCLQAAIACRGHHAEGSKQSEASTGNRLVRPSPRTRFASRFAVDTARRMADGDLDRPAWL